MTRILIADSSLLVCEILRKTFGDSEIELRFAVTGAEATQLLLSERFDVAVMESRLVSTTGASLLALASDENVPVLLLSGQVDTAFQIIDPAKTEALFCFAYLPAHAALIMLESLDIVRRVKAADHATRHAGAVLLSEEALKRVIRQRRGDIKHGAR